MDALRGTRSDHLRHQDGGDFFTELSQDALNQTPASMLVPLIGEFGSDRVEIRLYHTPNLRGIWKRITPKRFNEGFGLQHTKVYGVDDEVIISG
jgi:CDP-diacylglycerol---glycerol-3-phosphate 3-phosphatidyltransferase